MKDIFPALTGERKVGNHCESAKSKLKQVPVLQESFQTANQIFFRVVSWLFSHGQSLMTPAKNLCQRGEGGNCVLDPGLRLASNLEKCKVSWGSGVCLGLVLQRCLSPGFPSWCSAGGAGAPGLPGQSFTDSPELRAQRGMGAAGLAGSSGRGQHGWWLHKGLCWPRLAVTVTIGPYLLSVLCVQSMNHTGGTVKVMQEKCDCYPLNDVWSCWWFKSCRTVKCVFQQIVTSQKVFITSLFWSLHLFRG